MNKNTENWQCRISEKLNFNTVFVSLPLYGKFIFGNLILDWSTNNIEHQCTVVTTYILDIKGHPTHHIRIVKNKRKHTKIQQTKVLVTCQRFGDWFLFGLVWPYSSNQKNIMKVGSKSLLLTCSSNKLWAYLHHIFLIRRES